MSVEVAEVAVQGLWIAIALTVPIGLVAAAAATLASGLSRSLGIDDPTAARVVRALSVLLAVGALAGSMGDRLVGLARADWTSIARVAAR